MKVSGVTADLVRDFKPGYRLGRINGASHYTVIGPDGEVVRLDDGRPVTLAATPRGNGAHYRKRVRQNLIEAGVIAKTEQEELVEKVKDAPHLVESLVEEVGEARAAAVLVEETFFGPRYRELLPAIVLNVSWEEYLAIEQCAGFIADKGPRAVKQLTPFLKMVERARTLMERQVELKRMANGAQIENGTRNGVHA